LAIYCPECATQATDDVKYCKKCGTSLRGLEALQSRNPDGQFDWSRTWVADMLRTEDERARRRAAMDIPDRPEDLVAAELKQVADLQKEIKSGIITAFAGVGLSIFLLIFMGAIAAMQHDLGTARMLNSLWAVGVIPFFVGVGILVNALFVSRHFSEHRRNILRSVFASGAHALREPSRSTGELQAPEAPPSSVPSVVEHTTRHLVEPEVGVRGKARAE